MYWNLHAEKKTLLTVIRKQTNAPLDLIRVFGGNDNDNGDTLDDIHTDAKFGQTFKIKKVKAMFTKATEMKYEFYSYSITEKNLSY